MTFTKVGTNVFVLPTNFHMSAELIERCEELFGNTFVVGLVTAPELGSDGNVYQTQQLAVRLPKETDIVIFKVLVSGD